MYLMFLLFFLVKCLFNLLKKKNVPFESLILLKRSLVFPILLFSSVSLNYSLEKAFLSFLAILWNSVFRLVYLSHSPLPFASLLFFSCINFEGLSISDFGFENSIIHLCKVPEGAT